jgi:hypothetical protein
MWDRAQSQIQLSLHYFIFAHYDTRTNQDDARPSGGLKEVSLTTITVMKK